MLYLKEKCVLCFYFIFSLLLLLFLPRWMLHLSPASCKAEDLAIKLCWLLRSPCRSEVWLSGTASCSASQPVPLSQHWTVGGRSGCLGPSAACWASCQSRLLGRTRPCGHDLYQAWTGSVNPLSAENGSQQGLWSLQIKPNKLWLNFSFLSWQYTEQFSSGF